MAKGKTTATESASVHAPEPAAPGGSGLEAGIIFMMVIVFLGIVVVNATSRPNDIEGNLLQAKSYMEDEQYGAAVARLQEIRERYPNHEEAAKLLGEAEKMAKVQRRSRETMKDNIETLRRQTASNAEELSKLSDRAEELEQRLANTTRERDQAREEVKAAQAALTQANTRLQTMGRQAEDARTEAERLSEELRTAKADAARAQGALTQQVQQLTADVGAQSKAAAAANQRADEADAKLRTAQSELNKTMQDLEHMRAAHGAVQRRADEAENQLQGAIAQLDEANAAVKTLDGRVTELLAQAKKLHEEGDHAAAHATYKSVLVLRPGDEAAKKGAEQCKAEMSKAPAEEPKEAPAEDDKPAEESGEEEGGI